MEGIDINNPHAIIGQIEHIDRQIINVKEEIRVSKRHLETQELRLQSIVAEQSKKGAEDRLTNADQRKTRLNELLITDKEYVAAEDQLAGLQRKHDDLLASISACKRSFSLVKLELRREIANRERPRRDIEDIEDMQGEEFAAAYILPRGEF